MSIDYRGFIEKYFTITTKEGILVPFKFNDIQNYYYDLLLNDYGTELQNIRENILKSRQFGFSSVIDAIFCVDFILGEIGAVKSVTSSAVYSHKLSETQTLFRRVNQFIDSWLLKTQGRNYANVADRGLLIKLRGSFLKRDVGGTQIEGLNGSIYDCFTAGAKTSGRGGTYQNLHWSEVAFYNSTEILDARLLVVGAEEQVSNGVGKIIRETTGNVADNFFADEYAAGKDGRSAFKSRFIPWYQFASYQEKVPEGWIMPDYYKQVPELKPTQAYWHFKKTNGLEDEIRMREYPTTDAEAFLLGGDPYFNRSSLVWYNTNVATPLKTAEFVGGL